MNAFDVTLLIATFLCSLQAGFLFAFAVVVMPGIKKLDAGGFLHAFQVMDRVIQDNHPLFLLVWIGSAISLLAAALLGFGQLDTPGRIIIVVAALLHVLVVQLPTISINIPLNNELQALDVEAMDDAAREAARAKFEPRWNRWNTIRTWVSYLVTMLLLILLFRQ